MINDLKDASTQLQDGSKTLAEGTDTLANMIISTPFKIFFTVSKLSTVNEIIPPKPVVCFLVTA